GGRGDGGYALPLAAEGVRSVRMSGPQEPHLPASREKLTTAAPPDANAANASASRVPLAGNSPNISATIAAPTLWPNSRAVACMPLAAPARFGGAEVRIARLFGVLKKPKPMPQTSRRQTMSPVAGCAGNRLSSARPAVITDSPQPPSRPAG